MSYSEKAIAGLGFYVDWSVETASTLVAAYDAHYGTSHKSALDAELAAETDEDARSEIVDEVIFDLQFEDVKCIVARDEVSVEFHPYLILLNKDACDDDAPLDAPVFLNTDAPTEELEHFAREFKASLGVLFHHFSD